MDRTLEIWVITYNTYGDLKNSYENGNNVISLLIRLNNMNHMNFKSEIHTEAQLSDTTILAQLFGNTKINWDDLIQFKIALRIAFYENKEGTFFQKSY